MMELTAAHSSEGKSGRARQLYMVLSPRSLSHANLALRSLFRNSAEPVHLSLITDSADDKRVLADAVATAMESRNPCHKASVYSASDLDEREEGHFSKLVHLRNFRRGHPCWRKITDPLLLANGTDEMILLDPDLYFPNRFNFEATPNRGVLLMWQRPSCLWPPEIVETAMNAGIRLAHHVDIGVGQWRGPVDIEWLDWLLDQLGSANLPRSMHIEAIVWAALAMRIGGGHLDPHHWRCWHSTQYNRVLRKLGASGTTIIRRERFSGLKCFHAGGEAKWWLPDAEAAGILQQGGDVLEPGTITPFVEIMPREFHAIQRNRRWLRKLGYYSIFK